MYSSGFSLRYNENIRSRKGALILSRQEEVYEKE